MAPKNAAELEMMLEFACSCDKPTAIRYPRGKATEKLSEFNAPIVLGKSEIIGSGTGFKNIVFAVGRMVKVMYEISEELAKAGIELTVVNVRFISPMDTEMTDRALKDSKVIFSCEENVCRGGFGEALGSYLMEHEFKGKFVNLALPDDYMVQGSPNDVRDSISFDPVSLQKEIRKNCVE